MRCPSHRDCLLTREISNKIHKVLKCKSQRKGRPWRRQADSARYPKGVATITFNRPKAKNSLDVPALAALYKAFGTCEDRSEVGAVVLTGSGDSFCAGVNLKGYNIDNREELRAGFREVAMWWHQMLHRVVQLPKPVLAAVNGIAVGGGLGLVLASDIAVCNERAKFFASWMSNGVANDGGSSYTLTKIVGFRRAMELMLTNRTLTAKEAVEWQICNRMYKHDEFASNVAKIAQQLADGPTHLQAYVKETLHDGWRRSSRNAQSTNAPTSSGRSTILMQPNA